MQFSPFQQSQLMLLLQGQGLIPGTAITSGTLPFAAGVAGAFAAGSQGANADTAFGWGDHALAGYVVGPLPPPPVMRHDELTALGGEATLVLAAAPLGVVLVLATIAGVVSVWRDPANFTIAGQTLTFGALGAGDLLDVSYSAAA